MLVRWNHPQLGPLLPSDFIAPLEQNGQICTLDQYVWEQACQSLRRWLDAGKFPLVPLSVNVSRADIRDPSLADRLPALLERYSLPPELLHLEITESAYMEDPQQLIATTRQLRRHGFLVEMDDFGSGFSSLNILKDVPVDVLKLDQCFLRDMESNPRSGQILDSVIRMANRLHLRVIAEGVDNQEQAELLHNMGCHILQGYYFSPPLSEQDFLSLLTAGSKADAAPPSKAASESAVPPLPGVSGTYLFNKCIGGAALLESHGSTLEILLSNDQFLRDTGFSQERLDACRAQAQQLFSPRQRSLLRHFFSHAGAEESVLCLPLEGALAPSNLRLRCRQLSSEAGTQVFFLLTERVSAQHAEDISGQSQRFRSYQTAVLSMFDEVAELDYTAGTVTLLHSKFESQDSGILQENLDRALTLHAGGLLPPDSERRNYLQFISREHLAAAYQAAQSETMDVRAKDGRWFRSILFPLSPTQALLCTLSITDLKQAEHQMVEAVRAEGTRHMQHWQETLYRILSELPNMLVFDYDPLTDCMTTCLNIRNQGMEPPIEHYLATLDHRDYLAPDSVSRLRDGIRQALASGANGTIEYQARYFGPVYRWYRAHYAALKNESGTVYRLVGRIEDIDEVFLREQALQKLAHYDPMTGFLNHDAARHAINAAMSRHSGGTLLVVDLDDFKQVNDHPGHLFGDELLKRAAGTIRMLFRREDILGRFGGDEFMIFLPGVHSRQLAENRAADVVQALQKIQVPKLGTIHGSVGVSITQDGYLGVDMLFSQADQALYEAKRAGKGRYRFYHEP